MPTMPYGYYDRTDPTLLYEKSLFVAGAGLQSAELNEIQEYANTRMLNIAGAIFKDGDIVRDAQLIVNATTGAVNTESGAIYINGAVRGVVPRQFVINTIGIVAVGVYLVKTVVTALQDPNLLDPAAGTRNYQQAGASRLKVELVWGFAGERSDAQFYPIYTVENGILNSKAAPPNLDSITQAIALYDRDSSGGSYVVSGLVCSKLADMSDGRQSYSVAEGKARIRGYSIEFTTATRLLVAPTPDFRFIDSEPHASTTVGAQRVNLDLYPVSNITQVRITAQKTVTMTHGAFSGVADQIIDSAVLSILSVVQGATTYVQGTDYQLTAGKVDWSLSGAEVATGSTYSVTYQYITSVTPTAVDSTGFTITNAVIGSLILVSYNQALLRLDRICVTDQGQITYIKGVSANWNPSLPTIPDGMLPLAVVSQTWDVTRSVVGDGVRVVPMQDLAGINGRLDYILGLVAQQQLVSDIHTRNAGAKKGLFTDPFLDDSQRDQGIAQTAAIYNGELTLSVLAQADEADNRGAEAVSFLPITEAPSVQQLSKTSTMLINPYLAFSPLPALVVLLPSIDRWSDVQTAWSSAITKAITTATTNYVAASNLLALQSLVITNLRQIDIEFVLTGFNPNERLVNITFDSIDVTPLTA